MFHRKGKELAKILRVFYYRSVDDDSGVVMKRSRVKATELSVNSQEGLQLTLPLYQIPV